MAALETIPVSVVTEEKSSQGKFAAEIFSSGERWMRGAAPWVVGWVLSVAILPIPGVHLSVPLWFFGGPIAAYFLYRTLHKNSRLEFDCPACHAHIEMPLPADQLPPVYIYCPKCDKGLKVDNS
jgi:hypothetical protein